MSSVEFKNFLSELKKISLDPEAGVAELRRTFVKIAETVPLPSDTCYAEVQAGTINAEWVSVTQSQGDAVLFYIHGGGCVFGTPVTHRAFIASICKATGLKAFSIDYRLAPENPFPAAIEDCVAAYEWLIAQGTDASRIVLAGDSAGGCLLLSTLLVLRDMKKSLPAAAVVLSPITDHAQTGESQRTRVAEDPIITDKLQKFCSKSYLGTGTDARNPLVSPLYADPTDFPPILVMVGSAELLLDDSLRWAHKAKKAGVDVELVVGQDMIHVWPLFAGFFPEADQGINTITAFISRHLV